MYRYALLKINHIFADVIIIFRAQMRLVIMTGVRLLSCRTTILEISQSFLLEGKVLPKEQISLSTCF